LKRIWLIFNPPKRSELGNVGRGLKVKVKTEEKIVKITKGEKERIFKAIKDLGNTVIKVTTDAAIRAELHPLHFRSLLAENSLITISVFADAMKEMCLKYEDWVLERVKEKKR